MTTPTTPTIQTPASSETRSGTGRVVVWLELPRQDLRDSDAATDRSHSLYDPDALCEHCERWDGMA